MAEDQEGAVQNEDELHGSDETGLPQDEHDGQDGGDQQDEHDGGGQHDEQDGQDGGGQHDEQDERPVSRATARVQRALEAKAQAEAEAKLLRDQAEFYRKQAEALAAQQQQRTAPPAQEEYVDPDEKWRRDTQATINRSLQQQAELADRANFALAAVKSPLQAKYVDRVEMEIQKARAAGNFQATRESVFRWLLSEDAIANYGKKTPAAAAAEQRVAAAKTRKPVDTRSNVSAPRGGKSLEERLRNMEL